MMKIYLKTQKLKSKGMSLIGLMVGIAIGSVLLLALSVLYSISKGTFVTVSSISEVSSTGFQAIDYLRMNIKNAGAGIIHPSPPPQTFPNGGAGEGGGGPSCGPYGPGNTWWVKQGWTYLGYFIDNWPRLGNEYDNPSATDLMQDCIQNYRNVNYPDAMYIGLQYNYQCFVPTNNAAFDKNVLYNSPYGQGTTQATACSDGVHNCGGCWHNDVYQYLLPHVVVSSNGAKGDQLIVTFAISNSNNYTDCLGNLVSIPSTGVSSTTTTTVPVLISNAFRISPTTNTLQCQSRTRSNGNWSVSTSSWPAANSWTDIFPNIEYMKVAVGVNDNLTGYGQSGTGSPTNDEWGDPSVNRYVLPADNSSPLDPNRIISVRLALVTRSANNMLPTAQAPTFTLLPSFSAASFPTATYTPAVADRLQRKLVTTTIYLENYSAPGYPLHCVHDGSTWYVKVAGIPWQNTGTATDFCCGAYSCQTFSSFNACETARTTQSCEVFPKAP